MKTKGYIQITGEFRTLREFGSTANLLEYRIPGYIDQTVLGLTKDDLGGELDPHG